MVCIMFNFYVYVYCVSYNQIVLEFNFFIYNCKGNNIKNTNKKI